MIAKCAYEQVDPNQNKKLKAGSGVDPNQTNKLQTDKKINLFMFCNYWATIPENF